MNKCSFSLRLLSQQVAVDRLLAVKPEREEDRLHVEMCCSDEVVVYLRFVWLSIVIYHNRVLTFF